MKYYFVLSEILEKGQPIDVDALAFTSLEEAEKEYTKEVIHVEHELRNYEITLTEAEVGEDEDPLEVIWNGYDPIKKYNNSFSGKLACEVYNMNLSQRVIAEKLGVPFRTFQDWLYGNRTPPAYVQTDILERIKKINPGT